MRFLSSGGPSSVEADGMATDSDSGDLVPPITRIGFTSEEVHDTFWCPVIGSQWFKFRS